MAITKKSIVCGPTRRSGERYGVRTATQITPKQITAAMATPIQGEYSPNISAPRILEELSRKFAHTAMYAQAPDCRGKAKTKQLRHLSEPELLRASAGSLRRYPAPERYHRLRASQRAVEPGQNALSTLLSEQAQRVLDLPNLDLGRQVRSPAGGCYALWRGFLLQC